MTTSSEACAAAGGSRAYGGRPQAAGGRRPCMMAHSCAGLHLPIDRIHCAAASAEQRARMAPQPAAGSGGGSGGGGSPPGLRSWLWSMGGGQSCSPSSAASAAAKGLGFASSSESLSSLRRPASTAADRWNAARCWAAMARPSRNEALSRCSIAPVSCTGWRLALQRRLGASPMPIEVQGRACTRCCAGGWAAVLAGPFLAAAVS